MESENQEACADLSGHDAGGLMNAALGTQVAAPMQMWEPPALEELSELLPGFEVQEFLGRGGMGAVYRAYQVSLERDVAIKILPPHLGDDPEFAERFRREARTMAKLSHPNIVHVYEFGRNETSGWFYLIMEFVDGADLASLIQSGAIAADETLNYIGEICSALHHAHDLGYVHRDVKPANVFLTKSNHIKVGDFGLAKLFTDSQLEGLASGNLDLTMTGSAVGTMDYIAPEVLRGGVNGSDHRSDIFSLGVMFYELLTGERPRGWFAPPSKKIEVDVRVDGVVLRAMDESPERRYQSAGAVRNDLRDIRSGKARLLEWAKVAALSLIGVSAAAGLVFMIWNAVSNRSLETVQPVPNPPPTAPTPEPEPEKGPIREGDSRMNSRVLTPLTEPMTFEPFTLIGGIRDDAKIGVIGGKSLGIALGIGESLYYAYPHSSDYSKAEHWTLVQIAANASRGRRGIASFNDRPVITFSTGSLNSGDHKCAIAESPFPTSRSNWHITDVDPDPSIEGAGGQLISDDEGVGMAYLDERTQQIYFAWSDDPGVGDGSWTKSRIAETDEVGASFGLAFWQRRPAITYGRRYSISLAHAVDEKGLEWPDASEHRIVTGNGAKFGLSFYSDRALAAVAFANRQTREFMFCQIADEDSDGEWETSKIGIKGTQYRPNTIRCGAYWICSGWTQEEGLDESTAWVAISADPKGRLGSWTVIPVSKGYSTFYNMVALGDTILIPLWTRTGSRLRIASVTVPQLLELHQNGVLLFSDPE